MTPKASRQTHADRWTDAGLDPWIVTQCLLHGWSFDDMDTVLCAEKSRHISADVVQFGLDPLEVLAAFDEAQNDPDRETRSDSLRTQARARSADPVTTAATQEKP